MTTSDNYSEIRAFASHYGRRFGLDWDDLTNEAWIRSNRYPHLTVGYVVHHAAVKMIRESVRRNPKGVSYDDFMEVQQAELGYREVEETEYVRWAFANLDEIERVAFGLQLFAELTYEEIGERLGMTTNEVRNSIRQAKTNVSRRIDSQR